MKICFLVVVYDKKLEQSSTLKSLLDIAEYDFFCEIVNNGPEVVDVRSLKSVGNIKFNIKQCIENRPLSSIYNDFIRDHSDADRFVILDDDSVLSASFIKRAFEGDCSSYDLELPKIYDTNGQLYYPLMNWHAITADLSKLDIKKNSIFSIGSGLIIGSSLVEKFNSKKVQLFNEAFSLYGVDFSFFWELQLNNFNGLIVTSYSSLVHNMSLHGEISEFKRKELYINFSIQMRHYPSIVNFKNFIYSLKQAVVTRRYSLFLLMLKCYFVGRHPNCSG